MAATADLGAGQKHQKSEASSTSPPCALSATGDRGGVVEVDGAESRIQRREAATDLCSCQPAAKISLLFNGEIWLDLLVLQQIL